jgi:23S rRNA pseudouridine2605 synthase
MPEERIQKILAEAGVASRRASEALIAAGRVRVNGQIAKLGDRADPLTASLEVDGKSVGVGAAKAYVALHKPIGVTSTTRDRHAERTVIDLIPTTLVPDGARLYPVGRLDQDSEGLILLTNDGEWAEQVLHPRFGVEREYALGLAEPLTEEQVRALEHGIDLEEGNARLVGPLVRVPPRDATGLGELLDPAPPELVWYRATLTQGWKRQLRRMFGAVGAPVVRLVRVRIGGVPIGTLRTGRSRRLSAREISGIMAPPAPPPSRRPRPRRPTGGRPR